MIDQNLQAHCRLRVALVVVSLLAFSGCEAGRRESAEAPTLSRLRIIAQMRDRFVAKMGKPPADDEEFREFVSSQPLKGLRPLGINSPEEVFVSERDGEAFTVVYGELGFDTLFAYESSGKAGKRYVVTAAGASAELDEQAFQQLAPGAVE